MSSAVSTFCFSSLCKSANSFCFSARRFFNSINSFSKLSCATLCLARSSSNAFASSVAVATSLRKASTCSPHSALHSASTSLCRFSSTCTCHQPRKLDAIKFHSSVATMRCITARASDFFFCVYSCIFFLCSSACCLSFLSSRMKAIHARRTCNCNASTVSARVLASTFLASSPLASSFSLSFPAVAFVFCSTSFSHFASAMCFNHAIHATSTANVSLPPFNLANTPKAWSRLRFCTSVIPASDAVSRASNARLAFSSSRAPAQAAMMLDSKLLSSALVRRSMTILA
mmetsp:Transcript_44556/g.102879  ORF Transcript_44556/g.102879 Transcript_44556/m.102879 type:complete len:287 (-) Transcript_44556:872-1732(-)